MRAPTKTGYSRSRLLFGLVAVSLVCACRAPMKPTAAEPGTLDRSGTRIADPAGAAPLGAVAVPSDPVHAATPHGSFSLTIRWPARTTQAIPQSARRLEVAAYRSGATTPERVLTAERPETDQSATISLTFDKLPVGSYQVTATARDAQGKAVAAGNAPLVLLANQFTRVQLTIYPTDAPAVTGFGVEAAVPGQKIAVFGRGFGESTGTSVAVSIGGSAIPPSLVERVTDGLLYVTVPASAKSGPVKVSAGGLEATSTAQLAVVTRIEASPSVAFTHQPAGRVRFEVKAFDAAGNSVSTQGLPWIIEEMECLWAGPCVEVAVPGPEPGTFDASDDKVGDQVGTASIRIGTDLVNAYVTVATHELTPADMPGGTGPLGPVPHPSDNEPTAARVALGRSLFFDPGLSRSGQMSCATCHDPAKGFADGRPLGLANDGSDLPRHTPTALNAAYFPLQFWDGRAQTLEEQAIGVFTSPKEFDSDLAAMASYAKGKYGAAFQQAYGADPTAALVAKAIASYERKVLVTGDSPFDKWVRGDQTALSPKAKIGLGMFLGKSGCVACHGGPTFSDGKFHNIGIPGSGTSDVGRKAVSGQASDLGAFKTPTLRNVALTAPYFHDGSRQTLSDAIRFYENFDESFPNLDPDMTRSNFSQEMLEFLNALTSPQVEP